MAGSHGMAWKSTSAFYDEIVCVPLIVRYPAKVKPGRTWIAAGLTDLMPTLLDFAGLPIPAHVQGHSFAPYLCGEKREADAPAYRFCERVGANPQHTRHVGPETAGSFMIRGDNRKYGCYPDGGEFYYDLAADPGELWNRFDDPGCKRHIQRLRAELSNWLAATHYQGRIPKPLLPESVL